MARVIATRYGDNWVRTLKAAIEIISDPLQD
jgi:hypothetical protein